MKRVLVVGGSGFVGSHVVRTALSHGGLRVASVSRTGQPTTAAPGLEGAEWLQGDVSKPDDLRRVLAEVDGVVSCLGGFGTNDAMRALNGEANAALAEAAAASGVKRFAYVSAAPSRRTIESVRNVPGSQSKHSIQSIPDVVPSLQCL